VQSFLVIEHGVTYRFEEVEEGGYFAEVIGLPQCITEGETVDETLKNIRDALSLCLEAAEDGDIDLPAEVRRLLVAAG
jgi:predicted RNase H-like HicB family nuclease